MYSTSAKTKECFLEGFIFLALVALSAAPPLECQAVSKPGCSVQETNYLGWKAEELVNPWVKLELVPQIGGRLIQVTFGGHDFLYINPELKGQVIPLERNRGGEHNYGGDKV